MRDEQLVVVTTAEGRPSFLVHRKVRDEFIDGRVAALYGTRPDGSGHEWEALEEARQENSIRVGEAEA